MGCGAWRAAAEPGPARGVPAVGGGLWRSVGRRHLQHAALGSGGCAEQRRGRGPGYLRPWAWGARGQRGGEGKGREKVKVAAAVAWHVRCQQPA